MAEKLYLSYWLRNFSEQNMLRYFEKLLRTFPFSKLAWQATFRIYALEFVEPPVVETLVEPSTDQLEALIAKAKEFLNPDCCYMVDGYWELWQFEDGWKLKPSAVSLLCQGPLFDGDLDDHVRIDAGLDSHFLPQPDHPESAAKVQS